MPRNFSADILHVGPKGLADSVSHIPFRTDGGYDRNMRVRQGANLRSANKRQSE
jgi:hypothetical protein